MVSFLSCEGHTVGSLLAARPPPRLASILQYAASTSLSAITAQSSLQQIGNAIRVALSGDV